MGDCLSKKLISHRQTKAFTVHTCTVLQLKADTSPKPSTPCYYDDISNLSLPMTGLMIMFPVLFQPQITANSVIRGLLCQPSSGPLTVCWPGAVFSQLRYAWTFGLSSDTNSLCKSRERHGCQSRLSSSWCGHCEPRFLILSWSWLYFFHIPFFFGRTVTHWGPLKTGDYDHFQPPLQVIWHLNHVPLFWLDPLPQLYFGWKDLSSHWLLCSMPALFDNLLGGRTHHLMCLLIQVWIENISVNDMGLKALKAKVRNW